MAHCDQALQFWGPWEGCKGEKRQLKPVEGGLSLAPTRARGGSCIPLAGLGLPGPGTEDGASSLPRGSLGGRVCTRAVPGVCSPLVLTRPARSRPSFPGVWPGRL